ncbi:MAG: hypothetical protein EOP10_11530 [Proteobacteria bacterium]|nr:MAG: hypothetical protein EOP10_11530 [Pseudomonadota bacterium]
MTEGPDEVEIVKQFAANLYARDKQLATVESYCRDANEFLRYLAQFKMPLKRVEPETLLAFRDHLSHSEKDRENSVRRKIIGVRQFFRFLASEKFITMTPFDEMPLPERDDGMKKPLARGKIEAMLKGMQAIGLKSSRDIAILRLLAFEGVKANEIIDLQWKDFVAAQNKASLFIGGTKGRSIFLFPETAAALKKYKDIIDDWKGTRHDSTNEAFRNIFVSFKGKDGSLVSPKLTRHGLKFSLYEIGERFQIPHLNTENLRHYAIEHLLGEGWDAEDIMQHLGLRRLGNIAKHMARRRQDVS